MELIDIVCCFVVYWGEMGFSWGVNCSVVQIYVLLFVYGQFLYVEEIVDILVLVCFNVSNSLKELLNWWLICVIYLLGDWCDYYEILGDVWEFFCIIVCECKECEFDFMVVLLWEFFIYFVLEKELFVLQDWFCSMLDFMQMLGSWSDEML